ncbi:MAG: metalloregulator ArsR/SmtB family transcription factor [Myxococcales bacterium]|nr:metalloregulator ArsR/SmtB family transcription factor [Myxococcales bacterium]
MENMEDVRERLYQNFARIGQALSSDRRLRILNLLCQGEKSVEDLAEATSQSVAATSAHLKVLRQAHLVEGDKRGRYVVYNLASDEVVRFWVSLRELAAVQLPEVREAKRLFHEEPQSIAELDAPTLMERVERGDVLLLDLRESSEYTAGHLPGARSMPAEDLDTQLEALPTDQEIVAYCRGPYCVVSVDVVHRLQDKGYKARWLDAGVAEWKAAGYPLERL